MQASLRAAFSRGLGPTSPNYDLNGRIAAAILSCFSGDLFDSTGLFRSLWMVRTAQAASDAQGMIDELLALDQRAGTGRLGMGPTSRTQRKPTS